MGLWKLITKDLIDALRTEEVVGYGSDEDEALLNAIKKMPPLFPLRLKPYFSSYEESVTPCDFETDYEKGTDRITEYEAKIAYALTRQGIRMAKWKKRTSD